MRLQALKVFQENNNFFEKAFFNFGNKIFIIKQYIKYEKYYLYHGFLYFKINNFVFSGKLLS